MTGGFKKWLPQILKWECVFEHGHYGNFDHVISENVQGDAGGLTKWGIDQRSHPKVDIENLTYSEAAAIYDFEYWREIRGDELPNGFDLAVFDIAVNNGKHTAGLLLQKALGGKYLGRLDGIIGPKTVAACNKADRENLLRLLELREEHYRQIVYHNPPKKKFLKGWLNRNNDLRKVLGFAVLSDAGEDKA